MTSLFNDSIFNYQVSTFLGSPWQFLIISETELPQLLRTNILLRPEGVAIKMFWTSNLEMEKFNLPRIFWSLLLVSITRSWLPGKIEAGYSRTVIWKTLIVKRERSKQEASRRALIFGRYRSWQPDDSGDSRSPRYAVYKLGRSTTYAYLSAFLFYLHLRLIRFTDFLDRKEYGAEPVGAYNRNHDPLRSYEVKWARSSLSIRRISSMFYHT